MPREPKVVDIQPVSRAARLRRYLSLLLLVGLAAGLWVVYSRTRIAHAPPPLAEPTGIRSSVYPEGDSLQVAVSWRLAADSARAAPESVRVEVGLSDGSQASVSTQSANSHGDTLRVAAPGAGQTASGYSCVAPIHRGQIRRESCTPWQFVRPALDSSVVTRRDSAGRPPGHPAPTPAPRVARIVVQPGGLQVDPDRGGRCARWQRENPGRSVWLEVNREAVPDCTGANGKPTVAQFCAFAVLEDGRRVKTENSAQSSYCDRLFREWAAERVS